MISSGVDAFVRFENGQNFKSQMPCVRSIAVNSTGEQIALGGPDGAISIHAANGRLLQHWEGHCEGTVYALQFVNGILFTASALCDIRGWKQTKNKPKLACYVGNIHDTRKLLKNFALSK